MPPAHSTTHHSPPADILILGAGLAGLHAARVLHAAGRGVRVLDKGRGVGGRAATRRWDGVPADHGAQFFTARSPEFRAQVTDWEAREVCFPWAYGFSQWENGTLRSPDDADTRHPRYACRVGMTALSKDLAAGLPAGTVGLGCRVVALRATARNDDDGGGGWEVTCEEDQDHGGEPLPRCSGRVLLLTMPVPQALALLETAVVADGGGEKISEAALAPLRAVNLGPTLAVLRRLPADVVPPPTALGWKGIQARDQAETVTWIGADYDKRSAAVENDGRRIFSLHGGPEFSRAHVDDQDLVDAGRQIVRRAAEMAGDWMADGRGETQVHRWCYANVIRGFDATGEAECYELPLDALPTGAGRVLVAGDAFCGAKVEGAWRSGGAAAARLLSPRPRADPK